jgi:hypothetical protein
VDGAAVAGSGGLVDAVALVAVEVQLDAVRVVEDQQPPQGCVDDRRVPDAGLRARSLTGSFTGLIPRIRASLIASSGFGG